MGGLVEEGCDFARGNRTFADISGHLGNGNGTFGDILGHFGTLFDET